MDYLVGVHMGCKKWRCFHYYWVDMRLLVGESNAGRVLVGEGTWVDVYPW
jgi:hypothetical protein